MAFKFIKNYKSRRELYDMRTKYTDAVLNNGTKHLDWSKWCDTVFRVLTRVDDEAAKTKLNIAVTVIDKASVDLQAAADLLFVQEYTEDEIKELEELIAPVLQDGNIFHECCRANFRALDSMNRKSQV